MPTIFKLPATGEYLFRGDTIKIAATITDDNGLQDLTGYEIFFTAKVDIKDSDTAPNSIAKDLAGGITVVDAVNGEILIVLDPGDTSGIAADTTYVADIQIKKTATQEIFTAGKGTIQVTEDVTRRTT